MPKLNGTQTHENLKEAFAGESQANRRYLYFAQKADVEGYPDVAALFRSVAEGETGHAFGHFDFLAEVGDPVTGVTVGKTADNLKSAAARLVELIQQARKQEKRFLLMLTGVPGSGKTLAGLHVVHSAIAMGVERAGDIVYLSGNTPLVVVLREALARDEHLRHRLAGTRQGLGTIRRQVRARIPVRQFINSHQLRPRSSGTARSIASGLAFSVLETEQYARP